MRSKSVKHDCNAIVVLTELCIRDYLFIYPFAILVPYTSAGILMLCSRQAMKYTKFTFTNDRIRVVRDLNKKTPHLFSRNFALVSH